MQASCHCQRKELPGAKLLRLALSGSGASLQSVSVAIRSDTANQVSMSRDAVGKYWLQNLVSHSQKCAVELPGAKLPREYLPAESKSSSVAPKDQDNQQTAGRAGAYQVRSAGVG
ncbi:hypothetical protein K469DRAFT_760007 [Zopfia rhizophila CBS 207.26]|uniref:Uncharacterized protein n=1 Tax=Zopfia rhizophila CBS 207.26 TaxID=1314779 RepID=A0A6A6EG81_9PEZI|nr:hypothetical protein K469DRAFT_760007 [Zopfia rhizophila CBS 207.26]